MTRLALGGGGGGGGGGSTSKDGGGGGVGVFDITPHKIAVCHLIQVFAPPAQQAVPFPFQSIAQHNRLGLFLFSLTRSCENFLEPPLEELINQLKAVGGLVTNWLSEHLRSSLLALSSPDDLFNFFDKLRVVLAAPEVANVEDDQIFLDPNSHLGIFLRCCILAFNLLTFEGVCHLLTNLGPYCNSTDSTYELAEDDDFNNESEMHGLLDVFDKYGHEYGSESRLGESSSLHLHAPKSACNFDEDNNFTEDNLGILRSRWQVEGYLNAQADFLEKDANSFPLNSFNAILMQLQKIAPDFHRVQYLQYLNALHHDDYISASDSLHCYFDYSAGMEGLFSRSSSPPSDILLGRYETALLCLGTMHCHFGHSKKALEALTEAVRVSQQVIYQCLVYLVLKLQFDLSE